VVVKKEPFKDKKDKVSCETSTPSVEKFEDGLNIPWKMAGCNLGIWRSGWISGPSAKLFRAVWDSLMNEFSTHGYTELVINGETNQFSAFLKWILYAEEQGTCSKLPIQYISQEKKYFATIQAVFQEDKADEWLEKTSADLERFLFQMNVPYRMIRQDPKPLGEKFRSQWRMDLWMPEKQEYLELCIIRCMKQDLLEFDKTDKLKNIWIGKVEEMSGYTLFNAVAENNYDKKGRIKVPSVLVPYMMAEWIP
jgi:hypothetical protein